MPKFFTTTIDEKTGLITGEDARHIAKSLRCKVGEQLTVSNGAGQDFFCKIAAISDSEIVLNVQQISASKSELPCKITLYQAMPKGDKLDLITQKVVELGVCEIVPVLTQFCVSRPDQKSFDKKQQRLQKIATEAAKQSGRSIIPSVLPLMSLTQAIQHSSANAQNIFFYEKATGVVNCTQQPATLGFFIGSEGGFSDSEADQMAAANIPAASLGNRILRCETAAIAAAANLAFLLEKTT